MPHVLPGGTPPASARRVLPLDPRPLLTRVCHLFSAGRWVTAIHRAWRPEDVGRCRRCEVCSAYGGGCLVLVADFVPRDAAADFGARGRNVQTPPV